MRRFLLCCTMAGLLGCDFGTDPKRLVIDLQANPATAAVGDTITFLIVAQGAGLNSIQIVFGDGVTDGYDLPGTSQVQVLFKHAYQATGIYQVQATVTDVQAALKNASLTVNIQ